MFPNRKRLRGNKRYTQETINSIIYGVNLTTVIGRFVDLTKRRNGDYTGSCPFCRTEPVRNDRCFRVSDKKSVFKCFACGAGGRNGAGFLLRFFNQPFDLVLRFMNREFFNNKVLLKETVVKRGGCIDETNFDLPF
jgi:DNA primase